MLVLAGQMQRPTRCREDGDVRRLREEVADRLWRSRQLLEVVQDQQHVSVPDVVEDGRRDSALGRKAKALRDCAPHDIGRSGSRQGDEVDAVGARRGR
jgi:hypothetical protein